MRPIFFSFILYFQFIQSGNFVCDIVLCAVDADCCIINSGCFRSDTIHPSGDFKLRDLKAILPFVTELFVIGATGRKKY